MLVGTGDWILASILGIIGRIGFNGANTFYDALLPHVAKEEDQDSVSARGYAMGYLGGGLLLAVNIVMIQLLPGTWGPRLSFLSVAIWWAIFTIPLLRHVPEPPAATAILKQGETVVAASFKRLRETLGDIQHYQELFKFLIAFLIYNDGIGTIIGVAAIYGAELGFGTVELVLALLLVQFVGIPYSLIFGRLPSAGEKRRPLFLAFVLFNMVALPLVGILGRALLPADLSGAKPAPYLATAQCGWRGKLSGRLGCNPLRRHLADRLYPCRHNSAPTQDVPCQLRSRSAIGLRAGLQWAACANLIQPGTGPGHLGGFHGWAARAGPRYTATAF